MSEYKLQLKGVCKSFPGVKALDNVQLSLRPGTVHALMGENGAGKSTLMKCLFGIYKMDAGEVYLDGQKIVVNNPDEAMKYGIAMVHQELQPVPGDEIVGFVTRGRGLSIHRTDCINMIHLTESERAIVRSTCSHSRKPEKRNAQSRCG